KKKKSACEGISKDPGMRIKSGISNPKNRSRHREFCGRDEALSGLSEKEKDVLLKLSLSPVSTDQLLLMLPDMDYTELSLILMQLLIGGNVKQISQGNFVRIYK
ncbi:MAG: hypothetical protein IKQ28_00275, partial [Lachnospiraceae bacterium]|nr:hypothetical protein [Lachnospiraceae bacterium]